MAYEILIVDDQLVMTDFLKEIIHEHFPNEKIYCTSNPNDAIEIFRKRRINIVLLDMYFGNKTISGLDLYEKLKSINSDFRAIAITSYDSKFGFKCGRLGFNDFIAKPIDDKKVKNPRPEDVALG